MYMRYNSPHFLESGATTIEVRSELPTFEDPAQSALACAFIPGLILPEAPPLGGASRMLDIVRSSEPKIEIHDTTVELADSWEGHPPISLIHLLYSMGQRDNLDHGLFSVHSSCVVRDSRGFLLIGHAGSGKTTTALKAVDTHGFEWYSGNKTLLEFRDAPGLQAVAGTPPVTVESSNYYGDGRLFQDNEVAFGDRSLKLLKDEYRFDSSEVAIKGIIFVRVNSGKFEVKQVSPELAAINLLPFFYDYFNVDIHLGSGRLFNPGFVDNEHREELAKRLAETLPQLSVHQVSGSFEDISSAVDLIADDEC